MGWTCVCRLTPTQRKEGWRWFSESSALLAMESLLTLMVAIWLDTSGDVQAGPISWMDLCLFQSHPAVQIWALPSMWWTLEVQMEVFQKTFPLNLLVRVWLPRSTHSGKPFPCMENTGWVLRVNQTQSWCQQGEQEWNRGKWHPGGRRGSVGGMGNIYH